MPAVLGLCLVRAEAAMRQPQEPKQATQRIFINYRRDDSRSAAGRLFDSLVPVFGEESLFMDVDAIEPGLDFVEVIQDAVDLCDVLIAVIGQRWLTASDGSGNARLSNPNDLVRLELEAALGRGVRVIPALVEEAQMPAPTDLPESLAPLARRNAVRISHESWRSDVAHLVRALQRALAAATDTATDTIPPG